VPRVRRCRHVGCHTLVPLAHWYCDAHRDEEAAYLAQRAKYTRMNDPDYQRRYTRTTRHRTQDKSVQYYFYKSREWSVLRLSALQRDMHLCQYCLAQGRYTQGNTVDHIVPIEYDPSLRAEPSNLATTCPRCHHFKTLWEQGYYGTGAHQRLKRVQPVSNIKIISEYLCTDNE
jgi:Restriction endonuclease